MAFSATPALEATDTAQGAATPAGKRQKCVLLIEDSEDAMLLVRYAMQEYGGGKYRLDWVTNLGDGLAQLSKGGVDVILLDLGLPESSGPACYSWVREMAPEIPVIVLTGDTREETEFAVTASGVEDYLVKDQVSGILLIEAIRAAIRANKEKYSVQDGTREMTRRFLWTGQRLQMESTNEHAFRGKLND